MLNAIIFILLTLTGIITHYPSFNFALYGDDWFVIYLYLVPDGSPIRFGPLPGLLTYLTPYGPAIFLMGRLYEIFGTNYHLYFMVSLIFKIFASWALFLAVRQITKSRLASFLIATLFLVGFVGIQTTDWVFYMNTYLASGLFFLSLYYQFKFFETRKKRDLVSQYLFLISSIIVASLRLFPLIFIIPLIEISVLLSQKDKVLRTTVFKITLFSSLILLLWLIGVFGGPGGQIYYAGAWTLKQFLEFIINNPLFALSSFLHWIGIVVFPTHPSVKILEPKVIGFLFSGVFILALLKSRKDREKLILLISGGLIFFIPLFFMWFYSNLRLTDSSDRYLLFPFAGFCILIGILSTSLIKYFKAGIIVLLIILIGTNFLATKAIYKYWLSIGRDKDYMQDVHGQIISSMSLPLTENDVIYLDFDDMAELQSVVFGLGFKILVLSKTLNKEYFPNIYDNNIKDAKLLIIKSLQDKISQGYTKEDLIERVFAFQSKDGILKNTTTDFRKELLTL